MILTILNLYLWRKFSSSFVFSGPVVLEKKIFKRCHYIFSLHLSPLWKGCNSLFEKKIGIPFTQECSGKLSWNWFCGSGDVKNCTKFTDGWTEKLTWTYLELRRANTNKNFLRRTRLLTPHSDAPSVTASCMSVSPSCSLIGNCWSRSWPFSGTPCARKEQAPTAWAE